MDSEFLKKQEKACKDPYSAYYFAKNVEGADIKACQEAVKGSEYEKMLQDLIDKKKKENYTESMDYEFLKKQEEACKDPFYAYYFAKDVPGADISVCQEAACKDSHYAYLFAKNVEGADIKICQEFACKGPFSAYEFALHVPGADILDEYGKRYLLSLDQL